MREVGASACLIVHARCRLPAAARRGMGGAVPVLVSPGEKMAAGNSWMLAWLWAGGSLVGLARFLKKGWRARRIDASTPIARAVCEDAANADCGDGVSAAAVSAKSGAVVPEAGDGRLPNARLVGLASFPDVHRAAGLWRVSLRCRAFASFPVTTCTKRFWALPSTTPPGCGRGRSAHARQHEWREGEAHGGVRRAAGAPSVRRPFCLTTSPQRPCTLAAAGAPSVRRPFCPATRTVIRTVPAVCVLGPAGSACPMARYLRGARPMARAPRSAKHAPASSRGAPQSRQCGKGNCPRGGTKGAGDRPKTSRCASRCASRFDSARRGGGTRRDPAAAMRANSGGSLLRAATCSGPGHGRRARCRLASQKSAWTGRRYAKARRCRRHCRRPEVEAFGKSCSVRGMSAGAARGPRSADARLATADAHDTGAISCALHHHLCRKSMQARALLSLQPLMGFVQSNRRMVYSWK